MTDINDLLFLDLETRSTVDLRKTGVYVYAAHPSTSVTVARLAIGMEEPWEWRPGRDLLPKYLKHLEDPTREVVAHNAQFERLLIEGVLHPRHGWPLVAIDRWICTMARARAQALPASLDGAGMALGLPIKKDGDGYRLMLQMCKPRRTSDGSLAWWEDEDRMTRLSDYCSVDVKVERQVCRSTAALPQPELDVWDLTETMNDRGVRFDLGFVEAASIVAEETAALLNHDMNLLTVGAVKTASNVGALKMWLMKRGVDLAPPPALVQGPVSRVLDGELKADPDEMLEEIDLDEIDAEETKVPDLRRRDIQRLIADPRVGLLEKSVLRCRLEAGKISVKKLAAISDRSSADGRVRGLLAWHGASTGRYISQGLQVQNFPRDVVHDWEGHRELLGHGAAMVDAIAGPPLDVVSKMLRGAIIPAEGHEIAAGDFASVEAVGVAWLAGQDDLVEAFRQERKIYEEIGARVYGVDPDTVTKESRARFVGKTLVLGCGYQMGWHKFRETCIAQASVLLAPEEAERAVNVYRVTYKQIPRLWEDMNQAAIDAVRHPGQSTAICGGRIRFRMDRKWLRMRLPSGRYIWYSQPLIETGRFGNDCVSYMAVNSLNKKWERQQTYGGRLTENAVQGLCRDLLVHAALRLEQEGYRPLTLIHDEVVCEPLVGFGDVDSMCAIMSELPAWAEGFPLRAEGSRGPRYMKS
jgi:DNA polymerase